MSLASLPPETLAHTFSYLTEKRDLCSLCLTNKTHLYFPAAATLYLTLDFKDFDATVVGSVFEMLLSKRDSVGKQYLAKTVRGLSLVWTRGSSVMTHPGYSGVVLRTLGALTGLKHLVLIARLVDEPMPIRLASFPFELSSLQLIATFHGLNPDPRDMIPSHFTKSDLDPFLKKQHNLTTLDISLEMGNTGSPVPGPRFYDLPPGILPNLRNLRAPWYFVTATVPNRPVIRVEVVPAGRLQEEDLRAGLPSLASSTKLLRFLSLTMQEVDADTFSLLFTHLPDLEQLDVVVLRTGHAGLMAHIESADVSALRQLKTLDLTTSWWSNRVTNHTPIVFRLGKDCPTLQCIWLRNLEKTVSFTKRRLLQDDGSYDVTWDEKVDTAREKTPFGPSLSHFSDDV